MKRIAVIGDSLVWGYGVSQDEIFTSMIARACPRVEVLNLGVSGYGTDQELLLWRLRAERYAPDVVILVIAGNDFNDNVHGKAYVYYYKPLFVLDGDRLALTNYPVPRADVFLRIAAGVAKRSYLLTQLDRTMETIQLTRRETPRPNAIPASIGRGDGSDQFPRTYGERLTLRLVREFVASVQRTGARPVVVLSDGQGTRRRQLAHLIESSSVPVVDLEDFFPSEDVDHLHLPRHDPHWTPAGHRLVADAILNAVLEKHLVSPDECDMITIERASRLGNVGAASTATK